MAALVEYNIGMKKLRHCHPLCCILKQSHTTITIINNTTKNTLITDVGGSRRGYVSFVCLCVCLFFLTISQKTNVRRT